MVLAGLRKPVNTQPETWMYEAFEQAERERIADIEEAWKAYKGKLPDALVVAPGAVNDNVYANFCKVVVNKSVAFLFGQEVKITLGGDEDLTATSETPAKPDGEGGEEKDLRSPEQKYLDEVFSLSRKKTLLKKFEQNASIAGHGFLKIWIKDGLPRLKVLDPMNVIVYSEDDDYESVYGYKIQWNGVDRRPDPSTNIRRNRPAVFRQRIEKNDDGLGWTIIDEISNLDTSGAHHSPAGSLLNVMSTIGWESLGQEPWPYPFSPIVDCQNLVQANEYYGMPNLSPDVIDLQRSVNLTLSNNNRIIRNYAHPKAWTAGLTPEQVQQIVANPGGLIGLPNPDATLNLLEMQSDLSSSDKFYIRLKENFHELTQIPEIATGKVENVGSLSGLALKILYGPLVELTEDKQTLREPFLQDLAMRILHIGGFTEYTMEDIKIEWPELLPTDPATEAQTFTLYKQIGVSDATLMERAGFDPEKEAEQAQLEAESAMENQAKQMEMMGDGMNDPLQRTRGQEPPEGADSE